MIHVSDLQQSEKRIDQIDPNEQLETERYDGSEEDVSLEDVAVYFGNVATC